MQEKQDNKMVVCMPWLSCPHWGVARFARIDDQEKFQVVKVQPDAEAALVLIRFLLLWWRQQPTANQEERVYFSICFQVAAHHHRKAGQELKSDRTWRQEPWEPWGNAIYCLAPPSSLSFPSYSLQIHVPTADTVGCCWKCSCTL